MPIYRVHKSKTHPYTIIDNTSINDNRLSAKAKGILLFLISKPDHWFINFPNLVSSFSDSTWSIRSGINELIKYHYIVRTQVRADDGRFSFYDYAVYEKPRKKTPIPSFASPKCGFRISGKRILGNRTLVNTDNKEYTKNNSNSTVVKSNIIPPAADVSFSPEKFKETTDLLNELKIINHKKLFDLYRLPDILNYAYWIRERNTKMKNPTGFILTALKEKWIEQEPIDNTKGLRVFFAECSVCFKSFAYEDYEPTHKVCQKCKKK